MLRYEPPTDSWWQIRCELSSGGSIPCSRCQRIYQDCEIDFGSKPVNKRMRLDELENEIRQLRSSISNLPGKTVPETSAKPWLRTYLHGSAPGLPRSDMMHLSETPVHKTARVLELEDGTETRPQSLDHLRLDPHQIDSLFQLCVDPL
ncbi:hypothetical protein N7532_004848 [Penicillium argentinense]|uniref:Uncharacterized protein n=1 Tax=Penicillium argentinense TaxID=1131581 RepID=A0A9W9KAD1_9EURO|nr:uncharacterized protein N7532_004848 [Penicillium argentinense]KAJ5097847.1 hypothetical protein N7532_004848 [Penicillium argentinense]